MMRGMVIDMNDNGLHTLARLRAFLDGTVAVSFSVAANECYDFIARTVRRFGYARLKRADKGVVLRFLGRVSGYLPPLLLAELSPASEFVNQRRPSSRLGMSATGRAAAVGGT